MSLILLMIVVFWGMWVVFFLFDNFDAIVDKAFLFLSNIMDKFRS